MLFRSEQADLGTGVRSEKHPKSILGRRYSEEDPRAGLRCHSSIPGKFHGQRSLVATVHGVAESDTTERPPPSHFLSLPAIFDYFFYLNLRFL